MVLLLNISCLVTLTYIAAYEIMVSFPDGNITLKASTYQCRVHRSVVSQRSKILGTAIAHVIESCSPGVEPPPVVVSDDDALLELYANAIYLAKE